MFRLARTLRTHPRVILGVVLAFAIEVIRLPVATHAADSGAATLTLTVSGDGSVAFEGEPIPSGDLARLLAMIYAPRVDKTVMLAADRHLDYGRVVEVMDACRAAGVERIGVVTVLDRAR